MTTNRLIRLICGMVWGAAFLLAACGDPYTPDSESSASNPVVPDSARQKELPESSSAAGSTEPETQKIETRGNLSPDVPKEESPAETGLEKIDWGPEISLAEMMAKAKSGEIREIEWHVMPNVLRAQTCNNRIFHLKNENKGVDLRNKLINAGVKIGKGGVVFRHVF